MIFFSSQYDLSCLLIKIYLKCCHFCGDTMDTQREHCARGTFVSDLLTTGVFRCYTTQASPETSELIQGFLTGGT